MLTAHPWKEKDNACPWTCAEFWFFTVSDSTSFHSKWHPSQRKTFLESETKPHMLYCFFEDTGRFIHPNIFIFNVLAGHSLVIFWNFGLSLIHTHISSHQHQPQYQTLRQSITSDLPSLVCKNTYVVCFLFFLPFNFCRLCVVIRFFHPRHNDHRSPTSKDFYPRFYPLHLFSYLNSW